MKRVLLTATVQSHIAQFHIPLIDLLHQNGYEVHVAARNNLVEKNGLSLDLAEKVYDIPFDRSPLSKRNILAYKELKEIINNNHYDIIHCNTPMGGVVTRLATKEARKNGTKVFYTAHGFHFYEGAPLINWVIYYPIEKWLGHCTDKIITITEEDFKLASRKFKTKVCHVHGVGANSKRYYPISVDEKEKLRIELGYSNDHFLLLCTGELNKNKNQSTVIKAVAKAEKVIPNIMLLLAGNGHMDQELKSLVKSLNLTDKVIFLGYRTDLVKYVNACDIIISASFREGLPLNVMEAMLCGKPVIASINRGHNELIHNGITGYLLRPDDFNGFYEYIIKLKEDENLLKSLGNAGRTMVQTFASENVLDEMRKVYEIC